MWTSKDTLELSYATLNFATCEITWKAGEFTPKRRNRVLWAFEASSFLVSDLENVA